MPESTDPLVIEYADDPLALIVDGALEPIDTSCYRLAQLFYVLAQIEKAA